jgi:hypothetical protein
MALYPFVSEVFNIGFSEDPDYGKLQMLLMKALSDSGATFNDSYDWTKNEVPNNRSTDFILPVV